jgi:large subunit ribosomal protein L13
MSYTAGTYSAKPSEVKRGWHLIDASGLVLGRLAAEIAKILRGKHKPTFTSHIDCGDHVVVVNADKIALTGNSKAKQHIFYWHTGHPGGVKQQTAEATLASKFPERLLQRAVLRMMPKESPLARSQFKHLHVYAGEAHGHDGQAPAKLDLAAVNKKNSKR